MRKYQWSLYKTLEFLNSRRPDLEVRSSFISQLSQYEKRLTEQGLGPQTGGWNELNKCPEEELIKCEELILRNTYLNAQMGPLT